jgi:hypothetical protein
MLEYKAVLESSTFAVRYIEIAELLTPFYGGWLWPRRPVGKPTEMLLFAYLYYMGKLWQCNYWSSASEYAAIDTRTPRSNWLLL